jgi:hypothetical protein
MLPPICAHADELVTNGNFVTGAGWTTNPDANHPWNFDTGTSVPSTGPDYAQTGCVGPQCITGTPDQQASLFQDLTTVVGDTYTLTFEFGSPGNPMELEVLFGSTVADDLVNIGNTALTSYTVTGLVATSTVTELEFLGRQDPGYDALTDVSVVTSGVSSVTPEPDSLVLLGTGVLGMCSVVRKRFTRC